MLSVINTATMTFGARQPYGTVHILYLVDTYCLYPYSNSTVYKNMWNYVMTFCVYDTCYADCYDFLILSVVPY